MDNMLLNELAIEDKGKVGDIVEFERRGLSILGKVSIVRELSCIVEIDEEVAEHFCYETPRTVVRHNNYKVVRSSSM
ncbi:DUF2187 domain-containing protein [Pradoshia sp. D12]|nr:DUF2187 domain-containing protein [Pradoshia sp. D12]TPF72868.1 DUF2187 domain-containing protein [Bacillus sp. D12]